MKLRGGNCEEGIQPIIASAMVEGNDEVWESNGEENPAMAGGLRATIRMIAGGDEDMSEEPPSVDGERVPLDSTIASLSAGAAIISSRGRIGSRGPQPKARCLPS